MGKDDVIRAHLLPDAALRATFGETDIAEEHLLDEVSALRKRILAAPDSTDSDDLSYDDTAMVAAKYIYRYLEAHPEATTDPTLRDGGDLYDRAKNASEEMREKVHGLTGFMVGWAANAALRCFNGKPLRNPAILEFSTD